jgi:hypothetical protein
MNIVDRLLTEGLSPVLFRRETVTYAIKTLEENRFTLTTLERTHGLKTAELKKLYFLSCSRTKSGGYMIDPTPGSVTYVLDGERFAQRYSGSPMDYWGPEMRDPKHGSDLHQRLHNDESEDRVYADQPYIPNAASYIHEVHCMVEEAEGDRPWMKVQQKWAWMFRKLYILCARRNVPLYLYTNESAFIIIKKGRAVLPKQVDAFLKAPGPDAEEQDFQRRIGKFTHATDRDKKLLDALIFLWKTPVKKDGTDVVIASRPPDNEQIPRMRYDLRYGTRDLKAQIMGNARKNPAVVNGFLQMLRQGHFSNIGDFVDALQKRYYPELA